jgi:hypothetical protein
MKYLSIETGQINKEKWKDLGLNNFFFLPSLQFSSNIVLL